MLVSTTVVSTRIFLPLMAPFSCANSTSRRCSSATTSPLIACPMRASVFASGTLPKPIRVKSAVCQVRTDLAFQNVITPVAYVLEQQQSQYQFGRCLGTASGGTVLVAFSLSLVDALDQFLILEKLIGHHHPRLPKRLHIFQHNTFPQGLLRLLLASAHAAGYDHPETTSILNVLARCHNPICQLAPARGFNFATESS